MGGFRCADKYGIYGRVGFICAMQMLFFEHVVHVVVQLTTCSAMNKYIYACSHHHNYLFAYTEYYSAMALITNRRYIKYEYTNTKFTFQTN